jgi:hypothetical protein
MTQVASIKARLSAVQLALGLLLLASLACGLVARPHPENGRLMAALDELTTFRSAFKRQELEKSLLDFARAQGAQPLRAVAAEVHGRHVPALRTADTAPPLQPLATVELRSLDDVRLRSQPESSTVIGVASAKALGASIAWRLSRRQESGPFALAKIELVPASLSQAEVDLEAEVAQLRVDTLKAQAAVDSATKKVDSAEQLYETRVKWKLPWKILVKTDEARKEAHATLDANQTLLTDTQGRYEAQAKRALSLHASPSDQPVTSFAMARVTVEQGGAASVLEIPAALELRKTNVPTLRGGDFVAAHKAGLWDELKSLDADRAIAAIRSHFNWHYRYVELLGMRVGGMTVLQILPCILPFLVFIALSRMRAVRESYNPFGTTIDSALPRVGFGARVVDGVVLVLLPFVAATSAATALLFIGQVPALPVLAAVSCLLLGIYTFGKLGELQTLIEAMVRSHSNPPPREQQEASPR